MTKQMKADIFIIFVTCIWGMSFPLIRNVLVYISYDQYLALRFLIASVIIAVMFYRKLLRIKLYTLVCGAILGICLAGTLGLTVYALNYTSSSNVAFITGLNIVLVPLVSAILLKKIPRISSVLGVVIGLIGISVLVGGVNVGTNIGDLLAFASSLCLTGQIILIDKFNEKGDPLILGILQIIFAAIIFLFISLLWGQGIKITEFNNTVVFVIGLTGIFGTALAFVGQTYVQKFTTPTHIAIIFMGEPIFGALFSLMIPDDNGVTEKLTLNMMIGGLFIISAIIISELNLKSFVFKKYKNTY
ncbi:DMT family transporter [Anaerosacchariphilus polymeriproducens]|uniref:DMT family transporter n=1 Tax=Anaerosacchariphilus polymeriproducens TaxID=1812858 RepID=A0A371AZF6_9FIRM|nr:DMT family transporter [Anaerosacchariphilus polymeriproducens]RDU24929.1 DMT family transporter [Anaerosacchariphilus polymeriproducens]